MVMTKENFTWINVFETLLDIICRLSEDNLQASKLLFDYYVQLPNSTYDFDKFKRMDPLTYIACATKSKASREHIISKFQICPEFQNNKISGIPSYSNEGHEWVYSKELFFRKTTQKYKYIFKFG